MTSVTRENVFKEIAPKDKAQSTHEAARAIINAEGNARDAKTARLKQQRLDWEAAQPAPEAAPKKTRAKKPAR